MASENHETVADVLAECRLEYREILDTRPYAPADYIKTLIDRISAAVTRERERDRNLLLRLLWFNAQEYREGWSFPAYKQTIMDACARLGIEYHESGRDICEEMDETELGKKLSEEVCDGE